jgi:hypothetical protein
VVTSIPEGNEKRGATEKALEEIPTKASPHLSKYIYLQIQEDD